ncbi:glycosyltransferase family 39 protein [bacterium]|nr:glycosyltransferase family 39 protein [bacterium]
MTRDTAFSIKKLLIIIISLAVVIRLVYVLLHDPIPLPQYLNLDDVDFNYLGYNFGSGQGLTDKHGEPTSTRFPLYPVFLGIIYFLFGYHPHIAFIIQALLGGLTPLLVYFIAKKFFDNKVSLTAAAIIALYPSYITYSGRLMSENIFLPLLALLILMVLRLKDKFSVSNLIITGVTLGILMLTRGVMVIMVFLIPLWILIAVKGSFIHKIRCAAVTSAAIVIILSPWIVRNYIHFNRLFITSSSGGAVLWMSMHWIPVGHFFNIDRAYAYVDSAGKDEADLKEFHRILVADNIFGIQEARMAFQELLPNEILPENEAEFNKHMIELVKREIISDPGAFIVKTVKEFLRFWHFLDDRGRYVFSYGIILPLFLIGLWFSRKRLWRLGLLLSFFLYTWALETIFMAAARYRMPFEIVMIVIGAYGLYTLFEKAKKPVLPWIFTLLIVGVNLFFNYNTMVLRQALRSAASAVGIPVSKIDGEMIPQFKMQKADSLTADPEE